MCAKSTSLEEYLKRYESNSNPEHLDCCAEEDIDLSPPRRRRKRYHSPSPEPDEKLAQSNMLYLRNRVVTHKESPPDLVSPQVRITLKVPRTHEEAEWIRFKEMINPSASSNVEPGKIEGDRVWEEELILEARSWKKKNKIEEKAKEMIKLEWGNEAEAELMELELEKDRPFARIMNDAELDSMMRERLRWGDPLAHLVKKSQSQMALPDLGDCEKMKESGFIIPQDITPHSWLKTGFDAAAPNRYGIKPGKHWDGVDRSNGFENQMFKRMNQKRATEKEAYLCFLQQWNDEVGRFKLFSDGQPTVSEEQGTKKPPYLLILPEEIACFY